MLDDGHLEKSFCPEFVFFSVWKKDKHEYFYESVSKNRNLYLNFKGKKNVFLVERLIKHPDPDVTAKALEHRRFFGTS